MPRATIPDVPLRHALIVFAPSAALLVAALMLLGWALGGE